MCKICNKCGVEKEVNEFYKGKLNKDGYRNSCKSCSYLEKHKNDIETKKCEKCNQNKFLYQFKGRENKTDWCGDCIKNNKKEYSVKITKAKNLFKKEYKRIWSLQNKEKINERSRVLRKIRKEENPEKFKKLAKEHYMKIKLENHTYHEKYPEKSKQKSKDYRNKNIEKIKQYDAERQRKNRQNPFYKFKDTIRNRIRAGFKGKGFSKDDKTLNILGCSFIEFQQYIQNQFEPWMTWDNYGNWNGYPTEINQSWELDHRIPLSSAKTEEDVIRLSHHSNFQPLCSYTNRFIKHKKL